jgi:hypothetical protein
MIPDKSMPGNQPFIAQSDRPELTLTPDTPLSELRVRDLAVILGQHPAKKYESLKESPEPVASPTQSKQLGEKRSGEKSTRDKDWGEKSTRDKDWGEKFTRDKDWGETSTIFPWQSMPNMEQLIKIMFAQTEKAGGEQISYDKDKESPIVRCPLVYTSFWGNSWTDAAHQNLARQLNHFHKDLLESDFMNVLTQYGVDPRRGKFVQTSFLAGVPESLNAEEYKKILKQFIRPDIMTEPQDAAKNAFVNVIVIYLDENARIDRKDLQLNSPGAQASGFHGSFKPEVNQHSLYYSFVAYAPDVNVGTVVASHEFAEMLTDPEPRTEDRRAWWGKPEKGGEPGTEIADVCEGQNDTITVGTNRWVVQKIYSVTDQKSLGQARQPIPPLAGGPKPPENDPPQAPRDQLPLYPVVYLDYNQETKTVVVKNEKPKDSFIHFYAPIMLLALQHEHLSKQDFRKIVDKIDELLPE